MNDHLLAQIEEQQRAIEKRRKVIDDNALKLHDGRRAYADGDQYRDDQGTVLQGGDNDKGEFRRPGAQRDARAPDEPTPARRQYLATR